MNRVAIITHYYNSVNYGGNLQAYALCQYLNKHGYYAEQLCYSVVDKKNLIEEVFCYLKQKELRLVAYAIKKRLMLFYNNINYHSEVKFYRKAICNRKDAFHNFNQHTIKHSSVVYDDDILKETLKKYDIFITGSDQVWNMEMYRPGYFLSFVTPDKKKYSYAASIANENLNENQRKFFKNALSNFTSISVREQSAKVLLESITNKQIECTVDPTLLLSAEEWEEIASPRIINDKYIFCYIMGNNKKLKNIFTQFAKKGV